MIRSFIASVVLAATAVSAQAATVEIDSVSGIWTAFTQDGSTAEGLNTSNLRWGIPQSGGEKSGYLFEATDDFGPYGIEEEFIVGTFTHQNNVLISPLQVQTARLSITMTALFQRSADDPSISRTFTSSFDFDHWETHNEARVCPFGTRGTGVNRSGCADRVRLLSNPDLIDSFVFDGITYTFSLTGFGWGADFWTEERKDNSAFLYATFSAIEDRDDDVDPEPPVVPLPGAVWGMLAGIGGLWALRRKRSA